MQSRADRHHKVAGCALKRLRRQCFLHYVIHVAPRLQPNPQSPQPSLDIQWHGPCLQFACQAQIVTAGRKEIFGPSCNRTDQRGELPLSPAGALHTEASRWPARLNIDRMKGMI